MSSIQVKKIKSLTGHKDALYTLEKFSGTKFFSAGGDGMVVLWDLEAMETGKMIGKVPASVYALSYNHDHELLVVGQNFNGIHLIDVDLKGERGSLAITESSIFDIQTNEQAIYAGCGSGELFKISWDLKVMKSVRNSMQSVRSIALHPERRELAAGFSDHCIRIYDLDSLALKKEFKAHEISVFTLRYHPQLPLLISGSRDARLRVWDIDKGYELREEIVGHMYAINHVTFSPDQQHFVTCSMDKSIKVWDGWEFRLLKVIDKARHAGHATSVNKLLWMNYRNWLVSCSDDRTISVWDINFAE